MTFLISNERDIGFFFPLEYALFKIIYDKEWQFWSRLWLQEMAGDIELQVQRLRCEIVICRYKPIQKYSYSFL